MTAPGAPRRVTVQVWANTDGDGFTGYVPETDTTATASTFDGARAAALDTAQHTTHEDPMIRDQAEPRWTCVCGRDNPPGRTGCSHCGSPQL